MAEVFTADNSSVGVAAPIMPGGYYPSIDRPSINGLGLRVPWGGGSMAKIQTSPVGGVSVAPQSDVDRLLTLLSINMPTGNVINYNFEGLVGPAGPPGPPGAGGLGGYTWPDIDLGGAALSSDVPETSGIVFTKSGSNVIWTTGTLRYKGTNYTIAAEATGDTNEYIYWDKDSTPTSLLTTDTLATAVGADKWVMCYNDSGTPYPAAMNKVFHGGLIQCSTLAAINANLGTVSAGDVSACTLNVDSADIVNLSVDTAHIANLNVTTGKIANSATKIRASAYTAGTELMDDTSVCDVDPNVEIQSVAITSQGGTIDINFSATLTHDGGGAGNTIKLRLYDPTPTLLWEYGEEMGAAAGEATVSGSAQDTPGSGSKTYTLEICGTPWDGNPWGAKQRFLELAEDLGK